MIETPSYNHLTLLGQHASRPANPAEAVLEKVANPAIGKRYIVRLTCPEFTSLCPLTGQPDFAYILIDYIPQDWIVESKSFKLLMASYRNYCAFHEACTMEIASKLVELLDPSGSALVVLVSERRDPNRRLLAVRPSACRRLGASPRHPQLSRARLIGRSDTTVVADMISKIPHGGISEKSSLGNPILGLLVGLAVNQLGGTFDKAQIGTARLFVNDSMKAPLFHLQDADRRLPLLR